MKIVKSENYKEMSLLASDMMIEALVRKPDALFCIATGSSPTGAYRLFAERIKSENIDASRMRIIKLDEWCGLPKDNAATCEHYISAHLLAPLGIPADSPRYISFDPLAKDSDAECARISRLLHEAGGIDCCILGLGKNGHLGLNEPGKEAYPFAHRTALHAKTKTHAMLSENGESVSAGYTLGIKDLLDSRRIILLAAGADKQEAYDMLQSQLVTPECPASFLWLHENSVCITDASSFAGPFT